MVDRIRIVLDRDIGFHANFIDAWAAGGVPLYLNDVGDGLFGAVPADLGWG